MNTISDATLADYKHMRQVGTRMSDEAITLLNSADVKEAGRLLGLMRADYMVFDNEEEMQVLMEFACFDMVRDGKTAIQRLADRYASDSADPDAVRYLRAACAAEFSIYRVEDVCSGRGVVLRDLFREHDRTVVDVAFGTTAVPGLVLCGRLVCLGDYWKTTGVCLPLLWDEHGIVHEEIRRLAGLLPRQGCGRNATIIHSFLEAGASEKIAYAKPGESEESLRATLRRKETSMSPRVLVPEAGLPDEARPTRFVPPVGRYDPCPCGSGRKFKFCCETKMREEHRARRHA
jgi:hypothetical protein